MAAPAHERLPLLRKPAATPLRSPRAWRIATRAVGLTLVLGALVGVFSKLRHRTAVVAGNPLSSSRAGSDNEEQIDRHLSKLFERLEHGRARSPYCQAPLPDADAYAPPPAVRRGATLRQVLVFSRHGDRAPQNILRDDVQGNMTWHCSNTEYTYLHDGKTGPLDGHTQNDAVATPALIAKRVNRIDPHAKWQPRMWHGTCAQAELTARGRAMLMGTGHALREVYVNKMQFLPIEFDSSILRVRATDVSRTLHSAQSLIEGLYPATLTQSNPTTPSPSQRKVNIYTLPTEIDPLHSNKLDQQCPRLARIQADAKLTPLWSAFMRKSLATRALIAAVAPLKSPKAAALDGKKGVPSVTENLMCRACWKKPQPCISDASTVLEHVRQFALDEGWTHDEAHAAMAEVRIMAQGQLCLDAATIRAAELFKSFDFFYRNNYFPNSLPSDPIVPLEMGPLLREILEALPLPGDRNNPMALPRAKAHVFLTHDGTLSGLLGALRAAPEHHVWPAYRSNLVIEVWDVGHGEQPRVRVLHDGVPLMTEGKGALQLADGSVSLLEFREEMRRRSVPNWEAACVDES